VWRAGDAVLYRDVWLGRVIGAVCVRLVEASDDHVVGWIASGAGAARAAERPTPRRIAARAVEPVPGGWFGHGSLLLYRFGAAHSLRLYWRDDGTFAGWYGNLERPWQETRLGWDIRDQILDVWNGGDGWRWKDEDEFAEAVEIGLIQGDEAREIRAEGERVMRETVLPTGWEDFQPDPNWAVPELPAGWDVV
jgi:hypothetical protein